jgi:AcrR family transcriptional regulator
MAIPDRGMRVGSDEAAPAPVFRRAKPADALDLALETIVREARVDMQALAAQLDVSPATLHRWFGSRAQLIEKVFERLAEGFTAAGRAEAQGEGDDRVCDYARRVMTTSVAFQPLRTFVQREPQLALRLLLGKDGAVHRVVTEQTRELIAETRTPEEAQRLDGLVRLIVRTSSALVWATFMVGDEPEIDSAVEIIRMVLAASRSTHAPSGDAPAKPTRPAKQSRR